MPPIRSGGAYVTSLICGTLAQRDDPQTVEWEVAIVIDLSSNREVTRAVQSLQVTLDSVDVGLFELDRASIETGFSRYVGTLPNSPYVAVLVLDEHSATTRAEMEAALRSLPTLCLTVVVAEDPSAWDRLTGVRGFIRAHRGHLAVDVAQIALQLATVFAPEMLIGMDLADWAVGLGTSEAPSCLARAAWHHADGVPNLVFFSHAERAAVETAEGVVVLPLYPCNRISQTRELLLELSGLIEDGASIAMSAPQNFIREQPALSGPYGQVVFLCRPSVSQ